MKLYHTSNIPVERPDTQHSREFLDFGKGFYLTSLYEQAVGYGQRFIHRNQSAWLSTYEFVFDPDKWKILQFDQYDRNWLLFISKCRVGKDDSDFDAVIGGIANDKVIRTLDRYFEGEIDENQALGLLKYEKPNIQYCIRSQKMLDECLKHLDSKQL